MASDLRSPARWRGGLGFVLACACWIATPLRAQSEPQLTQYQVEAAFLYNFAKYVTWPPQAFAGPDAPLVIGVLGDDPFGDDLTAATARAKTVQGRPLQVVRGRSAAELARCHILFVSSSEESRLAQHLAVLNRANSFALTVGETDDFLRAGGMIRFVVETNKVRFEINAANAERAGLAISSKLLSLARNPRPRSS